MNTTNPYVAGNPVGGTDQFIGRQDILSGVLNDLSKTSANVIVLSGRRRIGKTSILKHLESELSERYVAVYFDLQDKTNSKLDQVFRELARAIAEAVSADEVVQNQLTTPMPTPYNFYSEFLGKVQDVSPNISLVLLFDEFDALDHSANPQVDQASITFFPHLRRLISLNKEQIKLVFAIGRQVNELSSRALSLLKAATNLRVSLLSKADTDFLVRLSEQNHSLNWDDEAVEKVWDLTHGHPYLTQRLCTIIWDNAYSNQTGRFNPPVVKPEMVQNAASKAIEEGESALQWIWRGLSPAERVIASAMAERTKAGIEIILQAELNQFLTDQGVRVITRNLQSAADKLAEWDFLSIESPSGYRFNIELIRLWLIKSKPLADVIREIEEDNPAAKNYYKIGVEYHRQKDLENAAYQLDRAVLLNPNYLTARLFLGQILLEIGKISEAIMELSTAYDQNPTKVAPSYVKALLRQAQSQEQPLQERQKACQLILELIEEEKPQTNEVQSLKPEVLEIQDQVAALIKRAELEMLYQQAEEAKQRGQLERAEELSLAVLNQERNHERARQLLSDILNPKPEKLPVDSSPEFSWRPVIVSLIVAFVLIALVFWYFRPPSSLDGPSTPTATQSSLVFIPSPTTASPAATSLGELPTPIATPHIEQEPTVCTSQNNRVTSMAVDFSFDGKSLACGIVDGKLLLYSLEVALRDTVTLGEYQNVEVLSVAFRPKTTHVAYGLSDQTVHLWDIDSEQIVQEFENLSGEARGVAFSPDGKLLAIGVSDGSVYLWEIGKKEQLHSLEHKGRIWSVAFSPEGSLLASASFNGTIHLWNVESGELDKSFEEESPSGFGIQSVAFSPDGQHLASHSRDGIVLWDVVSGDKVILRAPNSSARSVAFSPNGELLASGSENGTISLWDVASRTPLTTLPSLEEKVHSVAFNHDGTRLAAGLANGTVRLWKVSNP